MVGPNSTKSPKRTRRSPRKRSIAKIGALHLRQALGLVDLAPLIKSASVASGQKVRSQAKVMKISINFNREVAQEMPNRLLTLISTEMTAERGAGMILVIAEDMIQEIADEAVRGIVIVIGLTQKIGEKMIADMTLKETGKKSHQRTWALICKSTERRPGSRQRVRVSEEISLSLSTSKH